MSEKLKREINNIQQSLNPTVNPADPPLIIIKTTNPDTGEITKITDTGKAIEYLIAWSRQEHPVYYSPEVLKAIKEIEGKKP